MMDGTYVLISGSASRDCPDDRLDMAVRFVNRFTTEVLRRGGGIVVLAGREESTKSESRTPRIFDWVALRAVEQFAEITTGKPRPFARVVMSDYAPDSEIDDANLKLLKNLEQRNVVERSHIRQEVFTGGEYRADMTDWADAMVAVGGGKGTYSAGTLMTELGKPVLPLDLQIGSIAEDGEGAIALHREMMSDPSRFFPNTYSEIRNRLGLISLNRGIVDPEAAALIAAEMVSEECGPIQPNPVQSERSKNPFVRVWRLLKELPPVAAAIRIIEFLWSSVPFAQL